MKNAVGVAGAVMLALGVCTGVHAERGTFKGYAVLNGTKFHEVKAMEGHPIKPRWPGSWTA